jgi:vancomycin resistance protein YoaR
MHIQKVSTTTIDREKIASYIRDFAGEINSDPVNSTFSFENGIITSFSPSETGVRVDVDKSVEKVSTILQEKSVGDISIELILKKLYPNITAENINNLGIKELLAEGRSNFRGSPQNRIKNIYVASQKFNGTLIKPEEDFSFVTALGEVDGEHGYYPELVIKQDKTEPEFGGGICQVSTTAFRAAINSGLKITARRNHAYPVGYYNPQGIDATVYIPKPDLKFINNTPGNILIQTKIVGTELIFQFYGTSDGRKVEIDGPHITEKNPDGSMKTYFIQKVLSADGSTLIDDTFKSAYESPSKFPHPGEEKFTSKPKDWSKAQWKAYKKANGL